MRIIFTSPMWSVNGINVRASHLVPELNRRGHDARILITDPHGENAAPFPQKPEFAIANLPVSADLGTDERAIVLAHALDRLKPCTYLPGYDFRHSRIVPRLDPSIRVVGGLHTDEPAYYKQLAAFGPHWNWIIAVSAAIEANVRRDFPQFADRLTRIPGAAAPPSSLRAAVSSGEKTPLRVAYAGRIVDAPKRVLDVVAVVSAAQKRGAAVHLRVAGSGSAQARMEAAARESLSAGTFEFLGPLSNEATLHFFANSDVFLLMSAAEGLPMSLVEAMAMGCVPIATNLPGGANEIVSHEADGFLVPVGDIDAAADALVRVSSDRALLMRLSKAAQQAGRAPSYSVAAMTDAYLDVFERAMSGPDAPRIKGPGWRDVIGTSS